MFKVQGDDLVSIRQCIIDVRATFRSEGKIQWLENTNTLFERCALESSKYAILALKNAKSFSLERVRDYEEDISRCIKIISDEHFKFWADFGEDSVTVMPEIMSRLVQESVLIPSAASIHFFLWYIEKWMNYELISKLNKLVPGKEDVIRIFQSGKCKEWKEVGMQAKLITRLLRNLKNEPQSEGYEGGGAVISLSSSSSSSSEIGGVLTTCSDISESSTDGWLGANSLASHGDDSKILLNILAISFGVFACSDHDIEFDLRQLRFEHIDYMSSLMDPVSRYKLVQLYSETRTTNHAKGVMTVNTLLTFSRMIRSEPQKSKFLINYMLNLNSDQFLLLNCQRKLGNMSTEMETLFQTINWKFVPADDMINLYVKHSFPPEEYLRQTLTGTVSPCDSQGALAIGSQINSLNLSNLSFSQIEKLSHTDCSMKIDISNEISTRILYKVRSLEKLIYVMITLVMMLVVKIIVF